MVIVIFFLGAPTRQARPDHDTAEFHPLRSGSLDMK